MIPENYGICPICEKEPIRKPEHKTCGNPECKGKHAENTKNRVKRQKDAEPFIRSCMETTRIDMHGKVGCVICGDFLDECLEFHHFHKKEDPEDYATLCSSCHRVFDSSNGGLRELKVRRKRYYKYNLQCMH